MQKESPTTTPTNHFFFFFFGNIWLYRYIKDSFYIPFLSSTTLLLDYYSMIYFANRNVFLLFFFSSFFISFLFCLNCFYSFHSSFITIFICYPQPTRIYIGFLEMQCNDPLSPSPLSKENLALGLERKKVFYFSPRHVNVKPVKIIVTVISLSFGTGTGES